MWHLVHLGLVVILRESLQSLRGCSHTSACRRAHLYRRVPSSSFSQSSANEVSGLPVFFSSLATFEHSQVLPSGAPDLLLFLSSLVIPGVTFPRVPLIWLSCVPGLEDNLHYLGLAVWYFGVPLVLSVCTLERPWIAAGCPPMIPCSAATPTPLSGFYCSWAGFVWILYYFVRNWRNCWTPFDPGSALRRASHLSATPPMIIPTLCFFVWAPVSMRASTTLPPTRTNKFGRSISLTVIAFTEVFNTFLSFETGTSIPPVSVISLNGGFADHFYYFLHVFLLHTPHSNLFCA